MTVTTPVDLIDWTETAQPVVRGTAAEERVTLAIAAPEPSPNPPHLRLPSLPLTRIATVPSSLSQSTIATVSDAPWGLDPTGSPSAAVQALDAPPLSPTTLPGPVGSAIRVDATETLRITPEIPLSRLRADSLPSQLLRTTAVPVKKGKRCWKGKE